MAPCGKQISEAKELFFDFDFLVLAKGKFPLVLVSKNLKPQFRHSIGLQAAISIPLSGRMHLARSRPAHHSCDGRGATAMREKMSMVVSKLYATCC